MKKILTDITVILDILLDRQPHVAAVDGEVIGRALGFGWTDFEDAVTAAAAEAADCEAIVSRDPKGFPRSPVRVLTPEAAAPLLASA